MTSDGKSGQPWFVRGDLDGFFGLAIDNLIQFLLIISMSVGLCGLTSDFVIGRILPGAAVSLVVGNLFYAWQARRLAVTSGRDDVTALPFGINTVSLFAFVLFVIHPTFEEWSARPGVTADEAAMVAWQVGLVACFLSGVIEATGGLVAGWIRRSTPRAALLATLAGIAVGFISMEFVLKTFASPIVALLPLAILLARYLGRARMPFGLPAGLCAVATGTALAWGMKGLGMSGAPQLGGPMLGDLGLHLPIPSVGPLLAALTDADVLRRIMAIAVPMGLINVLGSLQCIESAEAEGDSFATGPSLLVNGLATMVASLFGSCYPTTIYIGHPGWKRMGARSGYSVLNGIFFTVVAFTGLIGSIARVIPVEAGMAILVWIAIIIVAQAFQATPREHAPAVVLGLLPGLAAWGWLLVELTQLGLKISGQLPWSHSLTEVVSGLQGTTLPFVHGLLTLKAGFMFSAMFLSAIAVFLIDRKFGRAAQWSVLAAASSFLGIMHSYQIDATAIQERVRPGFAWQAGVGYLLMAGLFGLIALRDRWAGGGAKSSAPD